MSTIALTQGMTDASICFEGRRWQRARSRHQSQPVEARQETPAGAIATKGGEYGEDFLKQPAPPPRGPGGGGCRASGALVRAEEPSRCEAVQDINTRLTRRMAIESSRGFQERPLCRR